MIDKTFLKQLHGNLSRMQDARARMTKPMNYKNDECELLGDLMEVIEYRGNNIK